MSKIDELLKNEKVEWKKLGEVCEFINGYAFKSNLFKRKGSPIIRITNINSGKINFGDLKYFDLNDYPNLNNYKIYPNDIVVAMSGATTGKIGYNYTDNIAYLNQRVGKFIPNRNILENRFLFHFLFSKEDLIFSLASGTGSQPNLSKSDIEKIEIPIPSIETQEKIVKILDKFTNYVTELQAELQARTKQYEYYRDMLLSEEYLNKLSCHLEENRLLKLEWKTLDEISVGSLSYGSGASAIDYDGETRYIRITDINDSGGLNKEKASPNVVEEKYILNNEDILFARSGATVGKNYIHLINDKCIYAGYLIRLIVNREIALPKFVFYCLNTNRYKIFVDNTKSRGSQPNINAKQYGSFKIPIIPIEIQNKVVEILDKFRSLLADTKGLLPKEIEQRQKQYEYYREKLLTFDENSVKREREREREREHISLIRI